MKKIFENWRVRMNEQVFRSKEELIIFLRANPNQQIYLDNPRGTTKKFGGLEKKVLPFDYGEWPALINPSDGMGWDLIIANSDDEDTDNLLPVGEVNYLGDDSIWNQVGKDKPVGVEQNSKIIMAKDGVISTKDKEIINNFFNELIQFQPIIWYQ